MGIKRIIAPGQFNTINGCFFDDFVTHGHLPVYLMAEYRKTVGNVSKKEPVKIPDSVSAVLSCHGDFYRLVTTESRERSPKLHLKYINEQSWDEAINKICSTWGKEAQVTELITKNKDNFQIVSWKRGPTENGNKASQLVISSVDDTPWQECHYKTQRAAAGELWADTCEFKDSERVVYMPTCIIGSHSEA